MSIQAKVGWRSFVANTQTGIDTDAQAFITAASITDSTQQSAINTLVTQLKTYGIWTKLKAVYPFVGGTATSHKFNLKDPRDLDAAYRLVFNGGWVHSSTGVLPNGTTAYADTKLSPSSVVTSPFIGYYSRSNTNTGYDQIDIGSTDPSGKCLWVSAWYNGSGFSNILARNSSVSVLLNGGTTTDSRGWYWTNKVNTTAKLGKNSTILNSATDTETPPSSTLFIGAYRANNNPDLYSNRETAFSVIADGMSDTDTTNLYTAIQTFQSTLGRQIGVPIVADTDAQAFLNAASITDSTQASAVNTLVTQLKTYGIWTKLKAVYPFVGGTATTHKFNLKDPRDLDAAYRLVFNGGWVHSATGALPNGTTGYADTYLIPNTTLSTTNFHLSFYSRTISNAATTIYPTEIGSAISGTQLIGLFLYRPTNPISKWGGEGYSTTAEGTTTMDSKYFGLTSRTNSTSLKYYKNGSVLATQTGIDNGNRPNIAITIGRSNGLPNYSDRESAFASIGDGLSDTEAANFYTAVQTFQTTLGRQVGVPIVADTDAQAFLNAAIITDSTQASAVNTLVTQLKTAGVWTKMKALYPFVGGTATSHKFNLKDPRDLDAAYRLVFNGGWVHSSTGALPNGTNGYSDTFVSNNLMNQNNISISTYLGADNLGNPSTTCAIGSWNGSHGSSIYPGGNTTNTLFIINGSFNNIRVNTDNKSRGLYLASKTTSTSFVHVRGNKTNVTFTTSSNITSSFKLSKIGDYNGDYSGQQHRFTSIGDGLTDAEATAFYTAVQAYQTSLGRQV